VRTVSVVDTLRQAFVGAATAGRLADFYVAPDRPALETAFDELAATLRDDGW
jgi:hypothetical protein